MSIKAGNTVAVSISCSGIGSRTNIRKDQEGNTIVASISLTGISSRANIREYQNSNTIEGSIFRSGIDSRPICMGINILVLVKLVGWDTLQQR